MLRDIDVRAVSATNSALIALKTALTGAAGSCQKGLPGLIRNDEIDPNS